MVNMNSNGFIKVIALVLMDLYYIVLMAKKKHVILIKMHVCITWTTN